MTSAPESTGPEIHCRIEPVVPDRIRFELSNPNGPDLWVLKWNTPLEGIAGPALRVSRDGEELTYQGPMFKRADPRLEDYILVPAHGHVEATVDLNGPFDVTRPGLYTIAADGNLFDVTSIEGALPRPRGSHEPMPLDCTPITFEIKPQ